MDWLISNVFGLLSVGLCLYVLFVLEKRGQKKCDKRHAEMIEAQKDVAEIIGSSISDAIKSGMDAYK